MSLKATKSLRELREQRGLTFEQLEAASKVDKRVLRRIEKNRMSRVYAIDITRLIIFFGEHFTEMYCE